MDPNTQPPVNSTPTPTAQPIMQSNEVPAQPAPTPPPLNQQANKKSLFLILGIILMVIILAILSVLLLLRNSVSTPLSTTQTVPTSTAEPTPTISQIPISPSSSDLQDASQVNTGDPTSDITSVEQDAAGL